MSGSSGLNQECLAQFGLQEHKLISQSAHFLGHLKMLGPDLCLDGVGELLESLLHNEQSSGSQLVGFFGPTSALLTRS